MAFNFSTPQWDSNTTVDKACSELFKQRKGRKRKIETAIAGKQPNDNKRQKSIPVKVLNTKYKKEKFKNTPNKIKIAKVPSSNNVQLQHVINKKKSLGNTFKKKHKKELNTDSIIKGAKEIIGNSKTRETTDLSTDSKKLNKQSKQSKTNGKQQIEKLTRHYERNVFTSSRKKNLKMSLRERMLEKLKGAQFRYLNEQMYTKSGHDSKKYFEHNPNDYHMYHEGYRQQVSRWPTNPLDIIIAKIKKMPKTHVIADFGCGEGRLAKSISQKVHSFDLVAVDDSVTACDMSKVPLTNNCIDVVVFCLSLMGTNLKEYLCEAARVLKPGGMMKIAEVESRFDNIDTFVQGVQKFGFTNSEKDLSHELFWFLDFIKKNSHTIKRNKLPDIYLNPCLYKRR